MGRGGARWQPSAWRSFGRQLGREGFGMWIRARDSWAGGSLPPSPLCPPETEVSQASDTRNVCHRNRWDFDERILGLGLAPMGAVKAWHAAAMATRVRTVRKPCISRVVRPAPGMLNLFIKKKLKTKMKTHAPRPMSKPWSLQLASRGTAGCSLGRPGRAPSLCKSSWTQNM